MSYTVGRECPCSWHVLLCMSSYSVRFGPFLRRSESSPGTCISHTFKFFCVVGLDDLWGLLQDSWFYDSVIVWFAQRKKLSKDNLVQTIKVDFAGVTMLHLLLQVFANVSVPESEDTNNSCLIFPYWNIVLSNFQMRKLPYRRTEGNLPMLYSSTDHLLWKCCYSPCLIIHIWGVFNLSKFSFETMLCQEVLYINYTLWKTYLFIM